MAMSKNSIRLPFNSIYYTPLKKSHNEYFDTSMIDVSTLPSECKLIEIAGSKGISVKNRHKGVEIYSPFFSDKRLLLSTEGHVLIKASRFRPSSECCVFMSFLEYIVYKTYIEKKNCFDKFPQYTDCIIICSPKNFSSCLSDVSRYKVIHCILPNDTAGKTMLLTLKHLYKDKIEDVSKIYYFTRDIYDYIKLKEKY